MIPFSTWIRKTHLEQVESLRAADRGHLLELSLSLAKMAVDRLHDAGFGDARLIPSPIPFEGLFQLVVPSDSTESHCSPVEYGFPCSSNGTRSIYLAYRKAIFDIGSSIGNLEEEGIWEIEKQWLNALADPLGQIYNLEPAELVIPFIMPDHILQMSHLDKRKIFREILGLICEVDGEFTPFPTEHPNWDSASCRDKVVNYLNTA